MSEDSQKPSTQPNAQEPESPDSVPAAEIQPETPDTNRPEASPGVTSAPMPHAKKGLFAQKRVLLITIILVLAAAGAAAYLLARPKQQSSSSKTDNQASTQSTENSAAAENSDKPETAQKVSLTGNTFLEKAKVVADLKLFKDYSYFGTDCSGVDATTSTCPSQYAAEDFTYYEIGSTKDGGIIYLIYAKEANGPGGNPFYVILGKPDKTYSILTDANAELQKTLNPNASIDAKTQIADLTFTPTAVIKNQKIKVSDYAFATPEGVTYLFGKLTNKELMGTFGIYDLYRFTSLDSTTFKTYKLYASINGYWTATAKQNGEIMASVNDDKSAPVTWSKGEQLQAKYISQGPGCGSDTYIVAKDIKKDLLNQVGATTGGQPVYRLANDNALVKELYEKDYDSGTNIEDKALQKLTIEQLNNKQWYFLAEDSWGDWVVYLRADLFVRGGCAKPVIYLYPTQPTNVSVSVGAQITKSDPIYPTNGWQNVQAYPNGSLIYNGKPYRYLFWEGYGEGGYPTITSGTVVAQNKAAEVMREQLAKQGLNSNEINDFMDFWTPLIPTNKYVRISWLSKAQLDYLAPLNISPRPQTVIRVFVDMEGLDTPISIAPPNFFKPGRNGFTAVEWGGLRRDGKIY